MSDNTNVHRVVGNLLVGTSHFYVDTSSNKVGITTSNPEAGLHVNSNAYVNTDFRVGADIAMNVTSGRITAGSFDGDGSLLQNINSDSGSWVNGTNSNVHLATSTDKVGVGTEDPACALDIAGEDVMIRGNTPSLHFSEGTNGMDGAFRIHYDGANQNDGNNFLAIQYGTNFADTSLHCTLDGRVGCGTSNPEGRLHISTASGGANSTGEALIIGGPTDCSGNTNLRLGCHNDYAWIQSHCAEPLCLNPDGNNVGVGTSDPQRLLHLKRTEVATFLRIQNVNNNNGCGIELMRGNTDTWGATAWSDWRINNTAHLDFGVKFTGTDIPSVLHLNVNGKIGVGNSDPGAKLHIGPLDNDHLYLASANNAYGWKLDTDDQGNGDVPFRIKKRLNGSDQTVLTIKNQNGNVGILRTSPRAALDVDGQIFSDWGSSGTSGFVIYNSGPYQMGLKQGNRELELYTKTPDNDGDIRFKPNDVQKMVIKHGGRVGIGTSDPGAILEVVSTTEIPRLRGDAGRSLFMGSNYTHVNSTGFSETHTAYAWGGYPGVVRMNSGGEYRIHGQTGSHTVLVRADGGFATFTGSHDTFTPFSEDDVGKIVYSTGNYATEVKDGNVNGVIYDYLTIMDSCPVVKICATENDKRVIGVLSTRHRRTQIEEISKEEYELITGDEKYAYEKKDGADVYIREINTDEFSRGYYNAVGEGSIWVCNKNGNFENGDYITSSTVAGYGQKQNDDLLHNYTVAKITADCDFSEIWVTTKKHKKTREGYLFDENKEPVYENILDAEGNTRTHLKFKIRYLLPDGTQISEEEYTTRALADEKVYIAAFVGCTYHCG